VHQQQHEPNCYHFGNQTSSDSEFTTGKEDHPELDISDILGIDDIEKYQSLIVFLQWAVPLGHWYVTMVVITMSNFRAEP